MHVLVSLGSIIYGHVGLRRELLCLCVPTFSIPQHSDDDTFKPHVLGGISLRTEGEGR